jgi:hypothetical protein
MWNRDREVIIVAADMRPILTAFCGAFAFARLSEEEVIL